jgi:hypothetical protein
MQLRIEIPMAFAVLFACSVAHAEQFVLADVTYAHSTETTSDSHYYPTLPADMPDDWTEPVDYAGGSVHIVLDVMTKPAGNAPTKLQICFEGTPSYACTLQSPTYTTTGRVEWDSPFASFWYESTVDWSQGTIKMPLILKDDMNNKPHGNPSYMPTDLRVQVTLVSEGATFVPPPTAGSGGSGGAAGSAGASGAGGGGAGGSDDEATSGSGGSAGEGGTSGAAGGGAAGTTSPRPAAGAGGASAQAGNGSAGTTSVGASGASPPASGNAGTGAMAGAGAPGNGNGDGSGCRSVGSGHDGSWSLVAAASYLAWRRRRQRSPRAAA